MRNYFSVVLISIFFWSLVFSSSFASNSKDSHGFVRCVELVSWQKNMPAKRSLERAGIDSKKDGSEDEEFKKLIALSVFPALQSPASVAFSFEPNFVAKPTSSQLSHLNRSQMRAVMSKYPYRLTIEKPTESHVHFSINTLHSYQTRHLFNDLYCLEQSRICDNQFNQEKFMVKRNELEVRYQNLESILSKRAKIYAQGSLNSLNKFLS